MSAVEVSEIQAMLTRDRLAIDASEGHRTAFLRHLGAVPRLVPGPWIAQRELIYALALANLRPSQRRALAKTVIVEHGRSFGVGHLALVAWPSGLPHGGSSLSLTRRGGGLRVFYTWGLAPGAHAEPCDWLLLRAGDWALDRPARAIGGGGLAILHELAGPLVLLVANAVEATEIAAAVAPEIGVEAHPRFAAHIESRARGESDAAVLLWPHDAIDSRALASREVSTIVLVSATQAVRQHVLQWAADRHRVEVVDAACPGRLDREGLAAWWRACARPKILLRGDPHWAQEGARWLRDELGATVESQPRATQLGLF
jgi:hypothetical protein